MTHLKCVAVLLMMAPLFIKAQQSTPSDMLYDPRSSTFAISGVGGSNVYLQSNKTSSSGQISLNWNVAIKDGYSKRNSKKNFTTLTTLFKYNPLVQTHYEPTDSKEVKKLGFTDNEFSMMLGLRLSAVSAMTYDKEAKKVKILFADASMTPYVLSSVIDTVTSGFKSFNFCTGLQVGYMTNTDLGLVGFMLSPELNYIYIYENEVKGMALEQYMNMEYHVSHSIIGYGIKLTVPLNDFCFFFECRKYYPLDNETTIPGLTDRALFTFGGLATGTVFKAKSRSH